MKKIFTFFAAMFLALTANATIRNITPTECFEGHRDDGYTLYVEIERGAQAGDTIMMADGEYIEPLTFAVKKPIVVMAADGARPVVKMTGYFEIYTDVKFEGIKFDHSDVTTNAYCLYFKTDTIETVALEDCEVTGFRESCIMSWSTYRVDSLAINNCYFHDNGRSCVYITKGQCSKLVITNSTFANNDGNPEYVGEGGWSAGIIDIRNTNSTDPAFDVLVDHCTFYNNKVKNGDHADVKVLNSANNVVSNCIFALADEQYASHCATYMPAGGNVRNCITYKYTKRTNQEGHYDGPTRTNCSMVAPLFVDSVNANFMLQAGSPAIDAASDGSNLGDPHWNTRTLYLKPGVWDKDGAKFAIWCFGSGSHAAQWSGFMTAFGEKGLYKADIPAGYSKVIFARLNSSATAPDWNKKDNQTSNMDLEENRDVCVITGWNEDDRWWSKYLPSLTQNSYYLCGSMNNWIPSGDDDLFIVNNESEYKLNTTLAENDQFKAALVNNDIIDSYYPGGTDPNYIVGSSQAGTVTIYLRPAGGGGEGWHYGTLYVEKTATSIDNINTADKAVKAIENGQIVIIKNGVRYNVLGTVIK